MDWLRRPAVREPPPAPRPAPPPAPEPHAAPGLRLALERLPRPGGTVLDLGPALAANVAFFNRIGARLRIADLAAAVDEAALGAAPKTAWERALPELFPLKDGAELDLVLGWDLANFLPREGWLAVARRLIPRLAAGGSFHALIRVAPTMPARPSRFRILEDETLSEELTTTDVMPAPRFPPKEVERLHPGLVAPRSHLGKHGIQEYLLELASEHTFPSGPVPRPRFR